MTHEQLIAQCFQWHWNTFKEERQMLYAVNNNSSNWLEGNKNKAKGVVAGVLDFCYILPNAVVWLDAKVGNDRPSNEQLSFAEKCAERGHMTYFFKSLDEFKNIITSLQKAYYG